MKYFYYISKSFSPFYNLALERALFDYASEEKTILFICQNDNTIVIGKNQNIFSECLVDEFCSSGGRIARRLSGGGAVYHDKGNLNISIISTKMNNINFSADLIIILENLGIHSCSSDKNDIVVDNKKISGSASYSDGKIVCHHCTLLIKTNINPIIGRTPHKTSTCHSELVSVSFLPNDISICINSPKSNIAVVSTRI